MACSPRTEKGDVEQERTRRKRQQDRQQENEGKRDGGDGRDGAVEETALAGQGLDEARASKDRRASEPVYVEGACLD